jgi:hypothetical protein
MHYAIVGTDHDLQKADSRDKGLAEKLGAILGAGGVALIAEEVDAHPDVNTFGRELSRVTIGENRWLSIDMDDRERDDAGISGVLANRANCPDWRNGKFVQVYRYFSSADGIRENFWLNRIAERCQELGIASGKIVITCGYIHRHYLSDKARERGHSVTVEEYLPYDFKKRYGELIICD